MQMLFNFPPSLQGPMTVAPPSSPDPSVPAAPADEECFDIAVPSKVRVRVRVRWGPLPSPEHNHPAPPPVYALH